MEPGNESHAHDAPDASANPHHYVLAHVAFRSFCQDNPLGFFAMMASPNRAELMANIWEQVRKHCDPEGEPSFDIADVQVNTARIKNYPSLVFTMPTPTATSEAYFVALVLLIDTGQPKPPQNPEFACWTLEKGATLDGSDRTVLCRWKKDDSHENFGDGPPPTLPEFARALENVL
jgi:hypothetical protein